VSGRCACSWHAPTQFSALLSLSQLVPRGSSTRETVWFGPSGGQSLPGPAEEHFLSVAKMRRILAVTQSMMLTVGHDSMGGSMRRILAAGTLVLAAPFGAAMAADMPLKAPPPVVEYNWSGLYWGANAGWAWDSFDWRYTNPSPATCCKPFSASID